LGGGLRERKSAPITSPSGGNPKTVKIPAKNSSTKNWKGKILKG